MRPAENLFDTVHQSDPLKFWPGGEFDPRGVSRFLDINTNDASKMVNISKKSVRYDDNIPKELLEYLRQVANICNLVAEEFDKDIEKTALWFMTPNPFLGSVAPRDMIRVGRYKKLEQFVFTALGRGRVGRSVQKKRKVSHKKVAKKRKSKR